MRSNEFTGINRRYFLVAAVLGGTWSAFAADWAVSADLDSRDLDALIRRMTIEEKAGQLHMEVVLSPRLGESDFAKQNPFMPAATVTQAIAANAEQLGRVRKGGIGMMTSPMDVDSLIMAQTAAVKESRLGIPLIFGADLIHGYRTVFPVPIAEAASFDPELARRTARAVAVEGSAAGHDMTYAPMVDIARDQRWGRVVEGAGEDVLLASLFAAARVRGFQGDRRGAADSLLACVKHFAAYGAAESGLDYAGSAITERVLHEVYLPPFEAAFRAGAILAMASFNTIDGVPNTGNRHLLTDILRGEMGFQGAVISDFESEKELVAHGYARDDRDAARLALSAGCDVGMISGLFPRYVPELVRSGALDEAVIDQAVRRILFVKREAGLFADPFRRLSKRRFAARAPAAHRRLAREAAVKSIVLLKNQNSLLPLPKTGKRIALIGPFASDTANLNGPWAPFTPETASVPIDQAFRKALSDPDLLTVIAGSEVNAPIDGGIDAAIAAARAADVVVLAVGEDTNMSGESASRMEVVVPEAQMRLAAAVTATGKPIVVILRNGRALALQGAVRDAPAILVGWFLGSETGTALADIVFGDVAPSGRLPMTFPLASGQEPYYYSRESSGRPAIDGTTQRFKSHFIGLPDAPLYPFGHGLTYGAVTYGATTCSAADIAPGGMIRIGARVTNTGARQVDEVVQLYIHGLTASVVQPRRKLVDFRTVNLAAGEASDVTFVLTEEKLGFVDRSSKRVIEPGTFDVWVAPSAGGGEAASFTLKGHA